MTTENTSEEKPVKKKTVKKPKVENNWYSKMQDKINKKTK
jgi:hypothetical protein